MNPKYTDPTWTAYVLGELTGPERARAEQELAGDADLREHLEALRLTIGLAREALAQPVAGGKDFMPDLQSAPPSHGDRFPLRYRFPTALAACLALFLGLRALLPSGTPPALLDETGNEFEASAAEGMIIPEVSFEAYGDAVTGDAPASEFGRRFRASPEEQPQAMPLRGESPPQPATASALTRHALNVLGADLPVEPEEEDEDHEAEEGKKSSSDSRSTACP